MLYITSSFIMLMTSSKIKIIYSIEFNVNKSAIKDRLFLEFDNNRANSVTGNEVHRF